MKREKRRVRLAKRQAMLADVSQRTAMRGLADALAEEDRSVALAQRSRALLQTNQGRSLAGKGDALSHAVAFTGALASLASDAEAAKADAVQQSEWQAQALGQAQTRARRHSERLDEAKAAYQTARERRESPPMAEPSAAQSQRLARLMQSETQETPRDKPRQDRSDP